MHIECTIPMAVTMSPNDAGTIGSIAGGVCVQTYQRAGLGLNIKEGMESMRPVNYVPTDICQALGTRLAVLGSVGTAFGLCLRPE